MMMNHFFSIPVADQPYRSSLAWLLHCIRSPKSDSFRPEQRQAEVPEAGWKHCDHVRGGEIFLFGVMGCWNEPYSAITKS